MGSFCPVRRYVLAFVAPLRLDLNKNLSNQNTHLFELPSIKLGDYFN